MLARYMLSSCVHLSVCLSDTNRSSTNMAKPRITQTKPHDSPGTLLFSDAKNLGEIPTGLLPTGEPNRAVVGSDRRFSTSISLYLNYMAVLWKMSTIHYSARSALLSVRKMFTSFIRRDIREIITHLGRFLLRSVQSRGITMN